MLPPLASPSPFVSPSFASSDDKVYKYMALSYLYLCCFILVCIIINITFSLHRMELRMLNQRRRRRHRSDPPLRLPVPSSNLLRGDGGDYSSDCAICLEVLREDEDCRVLPGCNHRFHISCIDSWLSISSSCPVCRLQIPPQPQIHIIFHT
uniref:RING-type domain-containing protein n=1 Tax=Nelumbo nucifera TaxID=4432 RepID=A0A822XV67_NELNU|nr:TPA_asm: hypothetical protein HUJ06_024158 [Nelumbo nucifera]